MHTAKKILVALLFSSTLLTSPVFAGEKEDLMVLRNTISNLMDALVQQGVMTREQADLLIRQAEEDAAKSTVPQLQAQEEVPNDVVRIPYVPEIVKEEIRQQVREELRQEVTKDVIAHAKTERWGIKDALPGWVNKIKISGDIRLRGQSDSYDSGNEQSVSDFFRDSNAANGDAPFTLGELQDSTDIGESVLNNTEDRTRARARLRVKVDAKVNDEIKAGIRLSTGNTGDPVSTNQTLGTGNNRYDVVLDRAFLQYETANDFASIKLAGGRIPNPFFSTDLLWDDDLGFEGAAGTVTIPLGGGDLYSMTESNKDIFVTLGAFPLEEFGLSSSRDKWLLGGQIGSSWVFDNQSTLKFAAAYYDFRNVRATTSPKDQDEFLASLPDYMQYGNTVALIRNPFDVDNTANANDTFGFGLATDYDILNFTASLDLANFAPYHLIITADYVKNIGYDINEATTALLGGKVSEASTGYHVRVEYGWPRIARYGQWNVHLAYKHLERDAVLDAFTDSDFRLGGTDSKGWELGGNFGLHENTWLTVTYRSAEEIDGNAIPEANGCLGASGGDTCSRGVDVLQVDLNSKF